MAAWERTPTIAGAAWLFAIATLSALSGFNGGRTVGAEAPRFALDEIADDDYAHFGQIALTTEENAGDIANIRTASGVEIRTHLSNAAVPYADVCHRVQRL